MASKFEINDLGKLTSIGTTDYFLAERNKVSYKVILDDLSKSLLTAHLSVSVGRAEAKGNNVLSVNYVADSRTQTNIARVELQDGILSAAKFSDTTNILSLYFNTTTPQNQCITVDLGGLVDTYTADGVGLTCTNNVFQINPGNVETWKFLLDDGTTVVNKKLLVLP